MKKRKYHSKEFLLIILPFLALATMITILFWKVASSEDWVVSEREMLNEEIIPIKDETISMEPMEEKELNDSTFNDLLASNNAEKLIERYEAGDIAKPIYSEEEMVFEYTFSDWESGARLKKDITASIENRPIFEAEPRASVKIDEKKNHYAVIEESVFYFASRLRGEGELVSADAYAFLRLNDSELREKELILNENLNFIIKVDTDTIPLGTHDLCLRIYDTKLNLDVIDCAKLLRQHSPLLQPDKYNELPLSYWVSPEGYYVEIEGNNYFYPGSTVMNYVFSPDKEYVVLQIGYFDGYSTHLYQKNGEMIADLSVEIDSIWKETGEGYRVYTCSAGGYSQYAAKYLDINTQTHETSETILSNHESGFEVCDVVNEHLIRVIERIDIDQNLYRYKEYSIEKDEFIHNQELKLEEKVYFDLEESLTEFLKEFPIDTSTPNPL